MSEDNVSMFAGQGEEGDFVVVRGEWKEVFAVGKDCFYNLQEVDQVRFKENFKRNILAETPFDVVKMPKLQGKIVIVKEDHIKYRDPVSTVLEKVDSNNIGTLNISFKNACFNSLGFMTHDTYVIDV